MQLSTTLQGIVNQQLVPTVDGAGRVVAAEVLVATPAVRALIRANKTPMLVGSMQTGGNDGMQTMDAALAQLVRSGAISRESALERSQDPEELERLLGSRS